MSSLYRCLIKIMSCLALWLIIFPGPAMGYDSVSGKPPSTADSGQHADRGGKIVMLKLAAESSQKQLQPSGDVRAQQPLPAKMPLQLHRGKRAQHAASAKTQMKRAESKPLPQPVAKHPSVDVASPLDARPVAEVKPVAETPSAIQEPDTAQPMMPAGQTPSLTEIRQQPLNDDAAQPAGEKNEVILAAAVKPGPEFAQQQDSIHDTVGIIARLLLKFSLITVCCIALFFSFSALQIAKSNQRIGYRIGEENGTR